MEEMQLERIEEKLDRVADAVQDLSTNAAVIENRTKDLEKRREESYQRQNKFSEKLDHVHECMHDVKARVEITHKILYVIIAAVMVAVITELVNVI